jgi:hypothetical protein
MFIIQRFRMEVANNISESKSRQVGCTFAVTISQLCYQKGEQKGERMSVWTFERCNLNHRNHALEANPFLYPEHKPLGTSH